MRIDKDQATAALRRVGFFCVSSADGITPLTGLTFAASAIQVNKAYAGEGNSAGTATEVGGGLYFYEHTAGEVDTLGALTIRLNKAGVLGLAWENQVV